LNGGVGRVMAMAFGAGVEIGHADVLFTLDLLTEVTLTARGTSSERNQKRFVVVCIGSRRITRASKSKKGGIMLRTIEEWTKLLRDKSPRDAAQTILRDIPHYRKGGGYESEDIEQLANALQAFVSPRDD
jgi:hypothetical protein